MTGAELTAVWLFGVFCGSVTACKVVRLWAASRVAVGIAEQHAIAHVEAHRIDVEAQQGPLTVPTWMTKDGES